MRKLNVCLSILAIIVFTAYSCKKNNYNSCNDRNLKEGYIIGFDQCTAGKQSYKGKGFVIVTNNFKDTLVTYNLPDSLYQFPPSHFANWQFSFLFPDSVRSKYRVYFSYRNVKDQERTYFLCRQEFNNAGFTSAVKSEIEILCIHK